MSTEAAIEKTSFPPISHPETDILILGTLPGDRSLQLGEYFAHPRNRFWKILAEITGSPLPENYAEKLELLKQHRIGLWNVLHRAERWGSLDAAITNEVPNDLPQFLSRHQDLKLIAFDGRKPEAFHDKYFSRKEEISYHSLPSCSPANARFSLAALCDTWAGILEK